MDDAGNHVSVDRFMDWMGYSIQYAIEMHNHKNNIKMPPAELDQKVNKEGFDILSKVVGNRSHGTVGPNDWDLLYESTIKWCSNYAGLIVEY